MMTFLDEEVSRAHRQQNFVHTVLLLVGIGVLLALPVWLIWGINGLLVVAVLIGALCLAARMVPPGAVMQAYSARRVTPETSRQLCHIVDVLAARAGLPQPPQLYVIPSLTMNAFATGTRSRSAIAITEGMLRRLDIREIAGVLAHEVSHIRNNDLYVMALADTITRMVQGMSYLALFLAVTNLVMITLDGEPHISWLAILLLYFAPAASSLMQLGLSRAREYDADLEAAHLTGDPAWLASALRHLERHTGRFWEDLMFPVPGRCVPQPSILRTHPATEDRIARLEQLDIRSKLPRIDVYEEPMVSMIGVGPIALRPRYRFPGIWY